MEFFIRKNSTEPILKMQLVQDGRSDFDSFYQKLVNSAISFSMKDTKNGAFVILNKAAGIVSKTNVDILSPIEYYIYSLVPNFVVRNMLLFGHISRLVGHLGLKATTA